MTRQPTVSAGSFRQWLAAQGCSFEKVDDGNPPHPAPATLVRRDGRQALLPAPVAGQRLDERQARAVVATLGLRWSDLPGRWEHFAHGADVGVRGIGWTLDRAFAEAARAMVGAAADPDTIGADVGVEIRCTGEDDEDLLYAWLNAIVYEMATRRMLFGRFDVEIDGRVLRATAWGEPVSPARHEPAVEIKGATFTGLRVRHDGEEWIAECVVDV